MATIVGVIDTPPRSFYCTEQMSPSIDVPPAAAPRAAVLAIGDEVLRGEIINGNAAELSDRLFALGLDPVEHAVVGDDPVAMREALGRLAARADLLVVTGGLGPTEDDRTVDVVAGLLGVEPQVHGPSLAVMTDRFARHEFRLTPNNLRQVRVPAGAEPLPNAAGLAPGFAVALGRARAFFMPGVPREMRRIFADHVAPRARALLEERGGAVPLVRSWHVYGMGESHIDHHLINLLDGIDGATLHFRTAAPENHVRVVLRHGARASDGLTGALLLSRLDAEVRSRLGAAVYGTDEETFALSVQRTFRAAGLTLGLAESCTGGYAGQIFTAEPGASDVFAGAIVSYANAVKQRVLGVEAQVLEEHGAVSEPCARQMATGARRVLGADVAVSVTGIAGPHRDGAAPSDNVVGDLSSGASPGGKPIGTVCFGVAGDAGVESGTRLFSGGRERIRRAAAYHALELARRAVLRTTNTG
jgi:nicotinamide-nucleotide amidase